MQGKITLWYFLFAATQIFNPLWTFILLFIETSCYDLQKYLILFILNIAYEVLIKLSFFLIFNPVGRFGSYPVLFST